MNTRAVSGLSLSAIHLANSRRNPIVGRNPNSASIGLSELRAADPVNETGTAVGVFPPRIVKNRGSTRLPRAATLPRISTCVSRKGGPHSRTESALSNGIDACSFLSLASSSTSGLRTVGLEFFFGNLSSFPRVIAICRASLARRDFQAATSASFPTGVKIPSSFVPRWVALSAFPYGSTFRKKAASR
jgi:hypothetical protein